jgi:hypothetical protein
MSQDKEDTMSIKSVLIVGFLSTMAAAASASNSFVTDAQSVGVIESAGSQEPVHSATSESKSADVTEVASQREEGQLVSVQTAGGEGEKVTRVDVIDNLPPGWQWDSMKPAGEKVVRVDVIDNVEWRGPVYAFTSGSMRVDVIDNVGS